MSSTSILAVNADKSGIEGLFRLRVDKFFEIITYLIEGYIQARKLSIKQRVILEKEGFCQTSVCRSLL